MSREGQHSWWKVNTAEEQVLQGAAEGAGIVSPGDKEAQGRPCSSLQLSERRL